MTGWWFTRSDTEEVGTTSRAHHWDDQRCSMSLTSIIHFLLVLMYFFCDVHLVQSVVLMRCCCQSICLSVTLQYRSLIGWISSKIIRWLVSLASLLFGTPSSAILHVAESCNISETGHTFDRYQNQRPWMILNGLYTLLFKINNTCIIQSSP